MPLEIKRKHREAEVVITGRGIVTGREVLETLEIIYDSEVASYDQLWDLTGVEQVDVSTDELRHMEQLDRVAVSRNPRLRVACAATEDLAYGLSRMWAAFVDDTSIDTHIARTLEEARNWLDSAGE